jgi:general secretion pathway protein F
MVRAGETSGTLEIVLQRLADIMEKQQELKSRIQTAMAYPILMTAIGTLVLFFLMTFVVPNITTIFEDMNQALPTPTRFLIAASDIFKGYWWLLVVAIVAALVALKISENGTRAGFHRSVDAPPAHHGLDAQKDRRGPFFPDPGIAA